MKHVRHVSARRLTEPMACRLLRVAVSPYVFKCAWIALMLAACAAVSIRAEPFPNRPIKLVTSGAPGSIPDTLARPLADKLGVILHQSVIVDNRPGAGGIVAMDVIARSRADGYTVGLATLNQVVTNRYLFAKLPYDPRKDLVAVTKLVAGPVVIAAHPGFPANSLQDLLVLAKARPGDIHFAIPQLGSPPHVFALMIAQQTNIDIVAVPFHSAPEALASVLAGQVPLVVDAPLIIAPHVKSRALKALAITGLQRSPLLPDTPTLAEAGLVHSPQDAWLGLVVPAGVPPEIVSRISEAANQALFRTPLGQQLRELGWQIMGGTPAEFAEAIRQDHLTWESVIRRAGLRLD